jgi:hypothetical protein
VAGQEDEKSRLDRELIELLNELRVALPGVQILFAFLLTVPFAQRFEQVTELQRDVYFVALLATLASSSLLIAPSAYHRMRWRARDKEQLLQTANRLAILGLALLGIAMAASAFFVTDFLFSVRAASLVTAACAALIAWFWFGLPVVRGFREGRHGQL